MDIGTILIVAAFVSVLAAVGMWHTSTQVDDLIKSLDAKDAYEQAQRDAMFKVKFAEVEGNAPMSIDYSTDYTFDGRCR